MSRQSLVLPRHLAEYKTSSSLILASGSIYNTMNTMANFAEKRDFLRMAIDCLLSFSRKGEQDSYVGHVVNLSSKGILFTASDEFEEGDQLDLVLTPTNSKTSPMLASVVVIRVTFNDSVYELACEILEMK